jgi:hypothetical protein
MCCIFHFNSLGESLTFLVENDHEIFIDKNISEYVLLLFDSNEYILGFNIGFFKTLIKLISAYF